MIWHIILSPIEFSEIKQPLICFISNLSLCAVKCCQKCQKHAKGSFNNYVRGQYEGEGGQKMSVFVHAGMELYMQGDHKMAKFCSRSC